MSKDNYRNAAALFDGNRLTLARELAGINKAQLAQDVEASAAAVSGWESGKKRPSVAAISRLSLRLGVAVDFFITRRDKPTPPSSTPHFRSLRSTTQLARRQAGAYVNIVNSIVHHLEHFVEFPPLNLPKMETIPSDILDSTPEEAAQELRKHWKLGYDPIINIINAAEHNGIIATYSMPQTAAVDAYSLTHDQHPLIVLNPQKNDYYRQRFDVGHEIGHLIIHQHVEPGTKTVENQADRFSAELLMPSAKIKDELPEKLNTAAWNRLKELKEKWGVSIQALLYRARFLGIMSDVTYRNAMITVTKRGWRRSEPGNTHVLEQPALLPKAIKLLEDEGITSEQLAQECGAPLEIFSIATSKFPSY
jgi:DNA-binding protein